MNPRRFAWIAGAIGVVLAALSRFVPGPSDDPLARVLILAVLGIAPLGLAALPPGPPISERLLAIAVAVQPIAGGLVIVSLLSPVGTAAAWTAPWMGFALLCGTIALARVTDRRPASLVATAALAYLPVGAAWLVIARMGLRPLDIGPLLATLTAVHFHFAAFAAPIHAARTIEAAPSRTAIVAGIAIAIAQPIVAAGILATPVVAVLGAILLALGLWTIAGLSLRAKVGRVPKILLTISALSVGVSMPLAVAYAAGAPIDVEWMIRLHGYANAHGFATCGLIAWIVARPLAAQHRPHPDAERSQEGTPPLPPTP